MKRRGLAMLMVMFALTTAGVLCWAMLSMASMNAHTQANQERIVHAENAADSGASLMLNYLANPLTWPVSEVNGVRTMTNLSLSPDASVRVDCVVTKLSSSGGVSKYRISSTARLASGTTLRSLGVIAQSATPSVAQLKHAAIFSGSVTLPTSADIKGGLCTDGALTKVLSDVDGEVVASNGAVYGGRNWSAAIASDCVVDANLGVWSTMPTYYYLDASGKVRTGTASVVNWNNASWPSSSALQPTTANPKNVYYLSGNRTLGAPLDLDGTLIVDGTLTLSEHLSVKAQDKMPAVIVRRNLTLNKPGSAMQAEGLCWLGGNLNASALYTNSKIDIKGALMMPTGSALLSVVMMGQLKVEAKDDRIKDLLLTATSDGGSVSVVQWGVAQ